MSPVVAARVEAGVPVLVAEPDVGARAAGPLPLVLWFHGFGVDAAANGKELARLADEGDLAVGVDAVGHGARRAPDLAERQAAPREQALRTMASLADATARELPALVDALVARGMADASRVAAAGVSMGGYLVYRAIVTTPAVGVAVALLGSPEWPDADQPSVDSPHAHLEAMRRVRLLSITGEHDTNVPPDAARRLHARLAIGDPHGERARYVELTGAPHLMSAEQWEAAMDETLRWLAMHLR